MPPSGIASRALTDEVDEHLLELGGVDEHGHDVGPDRDAQRDALAQRAVEQPLEVADERARVDDLRRDDLAAAEHQQLAGERGGAVGGAADLLDVVAHGVVGRELALGEADAGEDHRQQVVEVVRDAAGELADALQALGLGQALLELGAPLGVAAALGDVGGDRADRVELAVGVAQRELDDEEAQLVPVAVRHAGDHLADLAGGQDLAVESSLRGERSARPRRRSCPITSSPRMPKTSSQRRLTSM